jgi:hypothetical protein
MCHYSLVHWTTRVPTFQEDTPEQGAFLGYSVQVRLSSILGAFYLEMLHS